MLKVCLGRTDRDRSTPHATICADGLFYRDYQLFVYFGGQQQGLDPLRHV
jgi:hypothetical protein